MSATRLQPCAPPPASPGTQTRAAPQAATAPLCRLRAPWPPPRCMPPPPAAASGHTACCGRRHTPAAGCAIRLNRGHTVRPHRMWDDPASSCSFQAAPKLTAVTSSPTSQDTVHLATYTPVGTPGGRGEWRHGRRSRRCPRAARGSGARAGRPAPHSLKPPQRSLAGQPPGLPGLQVCVCAQLLMRVKL